MANFEVPSEDLFPRDPSSIAPNVFEFESAESVNLVDPLIVSTVRGYRWVVVVGGLLSFFMAWGIGANDVANAFATSVGAGAITLKWACVIAAVFEFLGALLLGSEVTDTIRKKIVKPELFDPLKSEGATNGPEIFMIGSAIVLFTAAMWLLLATYLEMPVSTTHSIIGAYIGLGFAYRGASAVVWLSSGSGLSRLKGVVGVVASWVISPVLSGILAVFVFLLVRTTVLRTKNPIRSAFLFAPVFYALTIIVTIFFILYKGDKRTNAADDLGLGGAFGVALGAGTVVGLFAWWFLVPPQKRYIDRWEQRRAARLKGEEDVTDSKAGVLRKVGINVEYDDTLDDKVQAIHDAAESFDPKAEQAFAWMQVFTASFDAFSHGANDVANSIAPFASIFSLYENGGSFRSVSAVAEFEPEDDDTGAVAEEYTFVGGPLDGQTIAPGDEAPLGASVCGVIDNVPYFRCSSNVFAYLTDAPDDASSESFSVYTEYDNGAATLTANNIQCFTRCNPGTADTTSTIKQPVPLWILAMGGVGIVAGLAMWGYRIILAIGSKLTKITPSRGFSIELGAAITVLIASKLGLPVSTTHCQVGATVGVGLIEGKKDTVNWKQLAIVFAGWVLTVVLTGVTSYLLVSFVIQSPQIYDTPQTLDYCPGQNLMQYRNIDGETTVRGVLCSGLDSYDSGALDDFEDLAASFEVPSRFAPVV